MNNEQNNNKRDYGDETPSRNVRNRQEEQQQNFETPPRNPNQQNFDSPPSAQVQRGDPILPPAINRNAGNVQQQQPQQPDLAVRIGSPVNHEDHAQVVTPQPGEIIARNHDSIGSNAARFIQPRHDNRVARAINFEPRGEQDQEIDGNGNSVISPTGTPEKKSNVDKFKKDPDSPSRGR